jgi:hypothetical protein
MDEFEKHLKIERLGRIEKHLGIWWEWSKDENGNWMLRRSMPKMAKKIGEKFEAATGRNANKALMPA